LVIHVRKFTTAPEAPPRGVRDSAIPGGPPGASRKERA
jgi:hypothetical protein